MLICFCGLVVSQYTFQAIDPDSKTWGRTFWTICLPNELPFCPEPLEPTMLPMVGP